MIRLFEKFNLKPYNSFGITAFADTFFEFTETEDIIPLIENNRFLSKHFVIGGGSNLLFAGNFNGMIIYPNIHGINVIGEDKNNIFIEVGAGETWDDFVDYAVKHDLGGIENLSNIPGKVGASPVQNIGAYGVEVKDRIKLVKGIFINSGKYFEFNISDCRFDYRNSIFKDELINKVVVTTVIFKLDKSPVFNLEYGSLKKEVEKTGNINIQNIRQAVINIRNSKLPDPKVIGNAGSFFKNPFADLTTVEKLKSKYSKIPVYGSSEKGRLKLAAGWLIDQCGWKGYREGDAGVHKDQALVLVNYGNATGQDIINISVKIKKSVFEKFGVMLEHEVNII